MDKYTVKMFPQAYRDLDQIYEQIALNSNYDSSAMDIVDQIEKAILPAVSAEKSMLVLILYLTSFDPSLFFDPGQLKCLICFFCGQILFLEKCD